MALRGLAYRDNQSVNCHSMCKVPGVMVEQSTVDSTWQRQRGPGGAFQLGLKGCVRVPQAGREGRECRLKEQGVQRTEGRKGPGIFVE